ncbi:MAG: gliding motility-associated C-terminal domain-containing protein [Bacteroidota bacterium]
MRILKLSFLISLLSFLNSEAQDIQLFEQFNGRFDYTAIGNTLNPFENNLFFGFCNPEESSSAELNLPEETEIIAAYLYWAGSGEGDTNVTLNGTSIEADDVYNVNFVENPFSTLTYFSCYAEITDFIISEGNINYEFSDLDISEVLDSNPRYCENRTNFAGWSIYVIYQDDNLPLNQINLYQGLQIINSTDQEINITIDNLNVIDNEGAKIGFLAWEGDNALNFGESLAINGTILSNPPLNLANNVFNGTNTFTNSNTFYNADLDVYDIQDNIEIGDTSATITMTTGELNDNGLIVADLIIINNIITVLNSQLPDATISLSEANLDCGDERIEINYTVFNVNSTDTLPENTPIAFYINDQLVGQSTTLNDIPINGSESSSIEITLPNNIENNIEILAIVDDNGMGESLVIEIDENNNSNTVEIEILEAPPIQFLNGDLSCNQGFGSGVFNLTEILTEQIPTSAQFDFYESLADLENQEFEIVDPENYQSLSNTQTVYARVNNFPCYDSYQFELVVENCPPRIPQGFSPNDDGKNDWFNIQGLYNIFENHNLKIYNRYGTLIFEGNNDKRWEGKINRGLNGRGNLVPVGTYFYLLELNDPNYEPLFGWVYVNY